MPQGEKRDKKDGRGRKQRPNDKRLQEERGKEKKWITVNYMGRFLMCKKKKQISRCIHRDDYVGRKGSKLERKQHLMHT